MTAALATLLTETFPKWQDFPRDCRLRQFVEARRSLFDDSVEIVTRCGQRDALAELLSAQHTEHAADRDDRVWNVLTEALAFAWVEANGFGCATWADIGGAQGSPDLRFGSDGWLEVKTVQRSDAQAGRDAPALERLSCGALVAANRPVVVDNDTTGLERKLTSAFDDALRKFCRSPEGGDRVVFIDVSQLDDPLDDEVATSAVRKWAQDRGRTDGVRLIVCLRANWRVPLVDSARG